MTTPAISVDNLSKSYRKQGMGAPTLHKSLSSILQRRKPEIFWALKGVSFNVPRGATVGIIGPNGSGKSSLLGLIARTITPTTGTVRTEGRISSLLELGAGFHPEMSGRENVILNASILGIPREDVLRRMDHIIEFSGLKDFIDMPVKHYSSGMYVRLGFAVAVEINPDILLTDEVLAVGDVAFQNRCMERLHDFKRRGKTMMFVSHALETVQQFCDEAFLILDGKLEESGTPDDVIFSYLRKYMLQIGRLQVEEFGTRQIQISDISISNGKGERTKEFFAGDDMNIEIRYHASTRIENPVFGFGIKSANGVLICGSNTKIEGIAIPYVEGSGTVKLRLSPLRVREGHFFLSLSCHSPDHRVQYHRLEDWLAFSAKDSSEKAGLVSFPQEWSWQADQK